MKSSDLNSKYSYFHLILPYLKNYIVMKSTSMLKPSLWFGLLLILFTMAFIQKQEDTNPLLAEWTGPYGGVPAFDKMDVPH